MKIVITLGQRHQYVIDGIKATKDHYIIIDADSHAEARQIAHEKLDGHFATSYEYDRIKYDLPIYYPLGEVEMTAMSEVIDQSEPL